MERQPGNTGDSLCVVFIPQVFLNLTKDLSRGEQADSELPQEVPGCTLESDEMSLNSDSFTERDGIILFGMRPRMRSAGACSWLGLKEEGKGVVEKPPPHRGG